jgi:hypothetical protein
MTSTAGETEMSSNKGLKAFNVQGTEFGRIVLAKTNPEAKKEGAAELGDDLKLVTCRRAKEFDQYAEQGKVPNKVLLEDHDWNFECAYCGCQVYNNVESRVWEGESVFCSDECNARRMNMEIDHQAAIERDRVTRQDAENAAREKFEQATNVCAYLDGSGNVSVRFNFPGGTDFARWNPGEEQISIFKNDEAAWNAYREPYRAIAKEQA